MKTRTLVPIAILLFGSAMTVATAQTPGRLCRGAGACSHDRSTSIYSPDVPTALDPEFARRLTAALVYAKERGFLKDSPSSHITSSFRSAEDQRRLLSEFLENPRRFPVKPSAQTPHGSAFAADLANIDPFSSPDALPALVIALEHQGLYYPFLEDPVHVEVHPASRLSEDFESSYFARYGQMEPPRLPYIDQLEALHNAADSMRMTLENWSTNITLNAASIQLVNKFLSDINDAEAIEAEIPNEDSAAVAMGPLLGDMYALYQAQKFPSFISQANAHQLLSLFGQLKSEYVLHRVPLLGPAFNARGQDAISRLEGWAQFRPPPTGGSSIVQQSDSRWGSDVTPNSQMIGGRSVPGRDGVQPNRSGFSSDAEHERAVDNESQATMTIQNGNGPVQSRPATVQLEPVRIPDPSNP